MTDITHDLPAPVERPPVASTGIVGWLRANKPPLLHLVITGRYAPPALVDYADLVTEMRSIKHPFETQGIRAQPGVEY